MARQLIQFVKLTDDLDGTEGDETTIQTVELSFEGTVYSLDLTREHAEDLRDVLAPYIEAAHDRRRLPKANRPKVADRPIYAPKRVPAATGIERDKDARAQIRKWASENGFSITGRGIIRGEAVTAYQKANPGAYIPPSTLPSIEVNNA